jgi:hypothetical protein
VDNGVMVGKMITYEGMMQVNCPYLVAESQKWRGHSLHPLRISEMVGQHE